MLSITTCQQLRAVGVEASRVEDFGNGLKLLQLVCQAYYHGDNPALSSKIKWSDDQKTGNKVVNVNMILNFIKKDPAIVLPPAIRELTAFRLIEETDAMLTLIEFLLSQLPSTNSGIEMSPPR